MTSARSRLSRVSIATALAMLAAPAIAGPAYLKLGDIKGESTDKGHKDQIEILSWSWGARSPAASGGEHEVEMDVHVGTAPAAAEAKKKGNVEYTWKVEEGEKAAPVPGEAEITLKGAAPARKVSDITLKRGTTDGAAARKTPRTRTLMLAPGSSKGVVTAVIPAGICKAGARYPTAELSADGRVYRLMGVTVADCAAASSGNAVAMETISLNYEEIKAD
jgi:hypothetical protein